MYRIRFHGRGGQGIKTASRMLGNALFRAGWQVQDAPRYGAERRGAPIFAYVRASHETINQRGVIHNPDLVVVADDTLVGQPSAGVLNGLGSSTVLLVLTETAVDQWRWRLNVKSPLFCLSPASIETRAGRHVGALCVGAAARLLGILDISSVEAGIRDELSGLKTDVIDSNIAVARQAFAYFADADGVVKEGGSLGLMDYPTADWVDLRAEEGARAAPAIHEGLTSVLVKTGLWRTARPVIDYQRCNKCHWVCSNYCPDNAISVDADGFPRIDLDHCKGCLICVAQCPPHAIEAMAESVAKAAETAGGG